MTILTETAFELANVHKVKVPTENGDQWADEASLLEQLQGLINGTNHGSSEVSGGGGSASKPPINLRALDLWQDIATTVNRSWPGAGRGHLAHVPLARKLEAWANAAPNDVETTRLFINWAEQIKRAINPVKRIEIMGTCPNCHCTHATHMDDETGERTYSPALAAYTDPAHASCAVCGSTWQGQELHTLRGLVRGLAD